MRQSLGQRRSSTAHSNRSGSQLYGRHGDINPGNILWFNEDLGLAGELTGILMLSDFGQAEVTNRASKTMANEVANTIDYRPPECDLLAVMARPTYDVWCMGCVYLELVTWMLGGNELVYEFSQSRKTRDLFEDSRLTETFFQLEKQDLEARVRVKVKSAVTEVRHVSAVGVFTK